jgi:hypothetical protein
LISLISPILTAPFGSPEQIQVIEQVLELDNATAVASRDAVAEPTGELHAAPGVLEWLKEGRLAL